MRFADRCIDFERAQIGALVTMSVAAREGQWGRDATVTRLGDGRWRHPRTRNLQPGIADAIAQTHLLTCRGQIEKAQVVLTTARRRWLSTLGLRDVIEHGGPWRGGGRIPWTAVYNLACLHAITVDGTPPSDADVGTVIRLLRLAVTDTGCTLARPSEWLATDPDLEHLHSNKNFQDLIRELAERDFAPAARRDVDECSETVNGGPREPWLREFVPVVDQTDRSVEHFLVEEISTRHLRTTEEFTTRA